MKTPMKKKVSCLAFYSLLVAGLFYGCRETIPEPELVNDLSLKNGIVATVPMTGTLPGGALYEIALPPTWNIPYAPRYLIVYAHGYRDFSLPLALPSDDINGTPLKNIILSTGLGYSSTSYRSNGLCVLDGVEDIVLLRQTISDFFDLANPGNPGYLMPDAVILAGPSEGGLITILTIEQNPGLFDAALATCCPIGSFYNQLQFYGDAHVLFKYFFGESLNDINLGSPKGISKSTMSAWMDGSLKTAIRDALEEDYLMNGGKKIMQYITCAKIPVDITNQEAVIQAILEVMRYPIMATNEVMMRMNGNPYNNKYPKREYVGSDNDRKLNLTIERICRSDYEQSKQVVDDFYETTGHLMTPLVTMHNVGDHISMFSHQLLYKQKVLANSPMPYLLVKQIAVPTYGHCNFTAEQILAALQLLLP